MGQGRQNGTLGLKILPLYKVNAIADCLENQFTHHELCDENHGPRVKDRVHDLLQFVDNTPPPERIRPCDLQKLMNSLKLKKAWRIYGIPNECLRRLPGRPLVHLTHLINNCIRLSHFSKSRKETKVITLRKPGKDHKCLQNLRPIGLQPTMGKLFEEVILKTAQRHIENEGLVNASQLYSVHVTAWPCNVWG
jgi:hypothetical protein